MNGQDRYEVVSGVTGNVAEEITSTSLVPWSASPRLPSQATRGAVNRLPQSQELERAVYFVLSRILGTTTGTRAYAKSLCQLVPRVAGLPPVTSKSSHQVIKQLGVSPEDLDDMWVVARSNGNLLPREVVEAFFPPATWPAFAALIEMGPVIAWERTENLLRSWARGLEPDGAKRKQRLATASVEILVNSFHRLAKELCELRKLADARQITLVPALLAGWQKDEVPARINGAQLGAVPANSDRRAPSLRAARLALRTAHRDVEARKANSHGRQFMGRFVRDRALLAVFLVLGGRLAAIVQLKRSDFVRFHRSGGHEGPALMLRPGKSIQRETVRAKFLPPEVGDWIQEWIDYVGINDDPDAPLWPVSRKTRRPLDRQGAYCAIVRLFGPFVPDRTCSPHTLRHLCEKLAFQAGMDWLAENRERLLQDEGLSGMPSSPQTFADSLLDHAMMSVQDRYKDVASELGRETWARIAAEGVWALVWGEKGSPKGPDLERIQQACLRVEEAEARSADVSGRLIQLQAQKRVLRQEGDDETLEVKRLVQLLLRTDAVADEIAATSAELVEAEKELEHARTELERAKESFVPLPDDADIAMIERGAALLDSERTEAGADGGESIALKLRDRITPREFQWAMGGPSVISEVTLRRYMRGQLPHPTGDRRNLWEPPAQPGELPSCIDRPSPRKTWILVERLDLSRFSSYVIDRLRYLQTLDEDEIFVREARAA